MDIKYLDLQAQYQSIKKELNAEIEKVLNSSAYVLGKVVSEFENSFSTYCGSKHCIAVNSGTSALLLALKALDVGSGDEVIVPANTFIATISAVVQSGATPVLVDVDPQSRNIDLRLLEKSITKNTKVIIPVHLYGQMADMQAIMKIAKERKIKVLEDAAQAHGAEFDGNRAGSYGDIAAFSFYPGKNLGAYGEGGAVVTNNDQLEKKVRMLRDHGSERKYYHDVIGYNARMDGIQGAVLKVKLKYLDDWNSERRRVADIYDQQLKHVSIPKVMDLCQNVYHLYVIECEQRDELMQFLKDTHNNITLIHYPIPNHLQKALEYFGHKSGDFPVTEKLAEQILSLPIYPEMTDEQVIYVSERITEFFG